ncbi:hypothetical protein DXG03_006342 [Asterophora parasitica]|uniref:Origin recognition complex subunit 5 n=1 Tax=Asterophora parasitica TaxID=117018 RepID=A0A9P7KDK1_9AGAR|nr:hypothetical protein DXG03_006342 [Asterophora parasitica]
MGDSTSDTWKLGYEQLSEEISSLVAFFPPPFLYINDATSPRVTGSAVASAVDDAQKRPDSSTRVQFAKVNAVACFTARLLYDSILNALTGWKPTWDEGCANWSLEADSQRLNDTFDGFIHGLCAVSAHLRQGKGKGKERMRLEEKNVRLVIIIEHAERLKETLPELLVPLTRLAELTQLDLTVIFISDVRWEDIRPSLGASPDPYFIDIPPPTKETIVKRVVSKFPASDNPFYHPSMKGLYSHFMTVLCDVCFPFTHDSQEIEYIAAARWPGFAQPVLDNAMDLDEGHDLAPPTEDVRMRLSRLFNASLSAALEDLYPRLINASDWAARNKPEPDLLAKQPGHVMRAADAGARLTGDGTQALPRMSRFILVAAFLASMNPAKSDVRMFGRGVDEKKRKRRPRKITKAGPAKIPQRLVGPLAFPLDRLLAILGALLEENDAESRLSAPEYAIPGEYTDMETGRIGISTAVMGLTSMRLLHRTTPGDRIDGPPWFKCGISYDVALALAKQLSIPLNDLLWDSA